MLKLNKLDLFCVHPGRFHVDEILAVAFFLYYHKDYRNWDESMRINKEKSSIEFDFVDARNTPYTGVIYRTAVPSIHDQFRFVIDVGRKYNEELGHFDHHQWEKGDSACMIVLKYLAKNDHINGTVFSYLLPWVEALSGWDTGKTINKQIELFDNFEENHDAKISHLSGIVAGFNRSTDDELVHLDKWIKAFNVVYSWLHNLDYGAKKYKEDIKNSKKVDYLNDHVFFSKTFIGAWKTIFPNAIYQIAPGSRKGEWGVTSKDSSRWPLPYPSDTEDLIFYHTNKFYASFNSAQAAKAYAHKELIRP